MEKHISVLKEEGIEALNLHEDSIIVDATLGYGGHSSTILKKIKKGHLYAFDQDIDAINYSMEFLKKTADNFTIINSNFVNMDEELIKYNVKEVDGVLFDLGVSSVQLDEAERGFSYHNDAKLDMRMNQSQSLSAYNVVNEYTEENLVRIFRDYGESKFAKKIARNIVKYRERKKIETTLELVDIIKNSVPIKYRLEKHPAKVIFQAIRIEVNHELDVLTPALEKALKLIKVGGRVAVITFHSLEDRIVKRLFLENTKIDKRVQGLPNIPDEYLPKYRLVYRKAISASNEEINNNIRSRSAKLRVIEKVR